MTQYRIVEDLYHGRTTFIPQKKGIFGLWFNFPYGVEGYILQCPTLEQARRFLDDLNQNGRIIHKYP